MALNKGQKQILDDCIKWYNTDSSQVFEIEGPAGSGKTYLIFEILKSLGLSAQRYLAMAYTGQASIVMRSRGFHNARTIHSSLYELAETKVFDENALFSLGVQQKKKFVLQKRKFLDPNIDLFFIDEAYMVPASMIKDILSFGKKVIVCGDSNQLPPVGDNPGFLTGYNIHRLTELMRQAENNPIIYLANRAIEGLPIHCGQYGNKVLVINDDEFIPEMVNYADVFCCGTNKTRDTINSWIRNVAGFASQLPIVGERIICRKNNFNIQMDGISLSNGLSGTVVSYPTPANFKNRTFTLNFKPDLINGVFCDLPINFDYFTAPFDKKQEYKSNYSMQRFMEGEFFEFAYALSCWLMQGSEYNNGIYIEEFMRPQIQRQLNYTAITRFKNSMIWIKKKNKTLYLPELNQIFNK